MRTVNSVWLAVLVACTAFMPSACLAQQATADEDVLVSTDAKDQRYWKINNLIAPLTAPQYPRELLKAGISACVAIGFFIEPNGTTSGHRILKSNIGNGPKLGIRKERAALAQIAKASMRSLVKARYSPGPDNPNRTRGFAYVPFGFWIEGTSRLDACDIPDLPAFLSNTGADARPQHSRAATGAAATL